jgi:hypothetical protein
MESQLAKQIMEAFAVRPLPNGPLSVRTYDDEGANSFFHGKTWDTPNVQELRHHEAAMHFFTPEAFRYYLPAFIMAELRNPEDADIIADNLAHHFAPDNTQARTRLSLFTREQLMVIAAFFEHCANRYERKDEDGVFSQTAINVRHSINGG